MYKSNKIWLYTISASLVTIIHLMWHLFYKANYTIFAHSKAAILVLQDQSNLLQDIILLYTIIAKHFYYKGHNFYFKIYSISLNCLIHTIIFNKLCPEILWSYLISQSLEKNCSRNKDLCINYIHKKEKTHPESESELNASTPDMTNLK